MSVYGSFKIVSVRVTLLWTITINKLRSKTTDTLRLNHVTGRCTNMCSGVTGPGDLTHQVKYAFTLQLLIMSTAIPCSDEVHKLVQKRKVVPVPPASFPKLKQIKFVWKCARTQNVMSWKVRNYTCSITVMACSLLRKMCFVFLNNFSWNTFHLYLHGLGRSQWPCCLR